MTNDALPRTIEYVALDDLPSALVNPKEHDQQLIEDSIGRFGFLEIPVLDERTGRLVAGHGRRDQLTAMRAAGQPPPEGITVTDDGRWLVPTVRGWSSTDDDEAHAAGIAINRGAESGGWNIPVLYDILDGLAHDEGFGLVGLGFDVHELDDMVAELQVSTEAYSDESAYTAPGSHAIPDVVDKVEKYATKGIRSIILDYTLTDFDDLSAACAALRRYRNLPTNAVLIAALIREAAEGLPTDFTPVDPQQYPQP